MIFDILKDKILFIFKRYKYNNNKISTLKNLSLLSIILFIIITRYFKLIFKNELNENNFDIFSLKDISNIKRLTLILKTLKEMKIKKFNFIDVIKVNILTYYYLIRNKKNKLFSLIINEINSEFIKSFDFILQIKRDNRISSNNLCLCDLIIKYKKCCKFYISKLAQINNVNVFTS